jgi:hypothetical protein
MSIIGAFRQRTPPAKPFDIRSRIAASGVRVRAKDRGAAVGNY